MRLFIFIALLSISISMNASEPIDFNPTLLSKVLKRQFDLTEFKMVEILHPQNVADMRNKQGNFFKLQTPDDSKESYYVYIGRVLSCRTGGCENPNQSNFETESEYFDYFIIYNSKKAIETVRVYNYQATHGQEVTAPGWLKQFVGYEGIENLIVGREIDAISGATISADAITMDVQKRIAIIKALDKN